MQTVSLKQFRDDRIIFDTILTYIDWSQLADGRQHVTYEGEEDVHIGFWWGNVRGKEHLEGLGVYGRIILKWIFKE
jgi:hypothetical protein